jgi:hypothetical protein
MQYKKINYLLLIGIFAILLVDGVVLAEDESGKYNTYDTSFIDSKYSAYSKYMGDSYTFQVLNPFTGRTNLNRNTDYTKDFWLPIEDWEYQVCTQGLSTQLQDSDWTSSGSGSQAWSGIYGDAVSVQAYRKYSTNTNYGNNTFLYEVAWYFQPSDKDTKYFVNMTGKIGSVLISKLKLATVKKGESGYYAFYSNNTYDKVILTEQITSSEQITHQFNIVSKLDAAR